MERHFTVTGFVISAGDASAGRPWRTLLRWHRKNQMWLPPGGHIEPGEDPAQAVLREVKEETGLEAEIVNHNGGPLPFARPAQLPPPYTILIEDIPEGPHQHIDLIYFLRPRDPDPQVTASPGDALAWVTEEQLRRDDPLPLGSCGVDIRVPADVRLLALRGIELLRGDLSPC